MTMKWFYIALAFVIFFIFPIGASISFLERERSLLTYASAFIVIVYMWYFGIRFISEFLKDKEEKK